MPKVCLITTVHPADDIRIFEKEAKTLVKGGYQVVLIAPQQGSGEEDGIIINGFSKPGNRFLRWFKGWQVLGKALSEKAEIYHFHDPEFILQGLCLQILSKKPVIYDVHEYYSEAVLTKGWIPGPLRRYVSKAVEFIEKRASRYFSGIITVNDHMKNLFLPYNGRVEAIYNFPFKEDYQMHLKPQVNGNKPIAGEDGLKSVLYLGGISKDRGLEMVLDAFPLIHLPAGKAQFQLAGAISFAQMSDGSKEKWDKLVSSETVRFLGKVPFKDIPRLLEVCQVAWLPWQQTPNNSLGIPTKLLEYMAAGKPVVVSNFGFIAEIVAKAQCGILVPAQDHQAHALAIKHLLLNPGQARKMGLKGQKAFLDLYNWQTQEGKLLDFYKNIYKSERGALENVSG